MSNYSQPDFYHFSEDSILLSHFAAAKCKSLGPIARGADFFAGCGIVGLEFLQQYSVPVEFDFYEISEDFSEHFFNNQKLLPIEMRELLTWHRADLLSLAENIPRYPLIMANPPFYDQEAHRPAVRGGESRRRCRSWSRVDRLKFISILACSLEPTGVAYILVRADTDFLSLLGQSSDLLLVSLTKLKKSLIAEVCLNIK